MRISKLKVKKAFLDHLESNAFGLRVIPEGSKRQASVDSDYLKESMLFGPTSITIDPNGGDTMSGIYQVDVCTRASESDFYNSEISDQIIDSFGKGRSAGIEYDGQIISVQRIDYSGMLKNEANTHLVHYISVYFIAV